MRVMEVKILEILPWLYRKEIALKTTLKVGEF
jgi:hypothetical protein